MRLKELKKGDIANITSLSQLSTTLKKRLVCFGITEGCEVCLYQKSFLGGPCIIECKGQKICLRNGDANLIGVNKS